MMDMHTLLPYPCKIMFLIHAYHVAWQNFNISQIGYWQFHQTFCFLCYNIDFFVFKWQSRHDNNYEWMILEDMQHSQPHINSYWEVIFLSWDGKRWCKVESLMVILLSAYLYCSSPPSYGGLNMILCSSLTETRNNNFSINLVSELSSMET